MLSVTMTETVPFLRTCSMSASSIAAGVDAGSFVVVALPPAAVSLEAGCACVVG
jgi:hypothetical protein